MELLHPKKHETLVKFTFDLYDSDGSGELSEKEVFNMVRLMRPSARADEAEKQTKKMMALMDRDDADGLTKDNLISFDEFMVAHRKMGSVIFPGERAKLMATCTTELTCMRLASPRLASLRFARRSVPAPAPNQAQVDEQEVLGIRNRQEGTTLRRGFDGFN